MHVEGTVTWVGGKYKDGMENREIYIDKHRAEGLPYILNERVEIDLVIGRRIYRAGLRATDNCKVVWISPNLRDEEGRGIKLAHVLHREMIKRNQKVSLDVANVRISSAPLIVLVPL